MKLTLQIAAVYQALTRVEAATLLDSFLLDDIQFLNNHQGSGQDSYYDFQQIYEGIPDSSKPLPPSPFDPFSVTQGHLYSRYEEYPNPKPAPEPSHPPYEENQSQQNHSQHGHHIDDTENEYWERVNNFDVNEAIFDQEDYEHALEAEAQQMVALEALRVMVNDLEWVIQGLKARIDECTERLFELSEITENLGQGVRIVDYAYQQQVYQKEQLQDQCKYVEQELGKDRAFLVLYCQQFAFAHEMVAPCREILTCSGHQLQYRWNKWDHPSSHQPPYIPPPPVTNPDHGHPHDDNHLDGHDHNHGHPHDHAHLDGHNHDNGLDHDETGDQGSTPSLPRPPPNESDFNRHGHPYSDHAHAEENPHDHNHGHPHDHAHLDGHTHQNGDLNHY